jgi:hypothetical protein
MIKKFKCGMCSFGPTSRKGLRDHLKEEHGIMNEITNSKSAFQERGTKRYRQSWWIAE